MKIEVHNYSSDILLLDRVRQKDSSVRSFKFAIARDVRNGLIGVISSREPVHTELATIVCDREGRVFVGAGNSSLPQIVDGKLCYLYEPRITWRSPSCSMEFGYDKPPEDQIAEIEAEFKAALTALIKGD